LEELFKSRLFKILIYLSIIIFLLFPKETFSSSSNNNSNSWIEKVMIAGFVYAVVKYAYSKFVNNDKKPYEYSETDSSSYALTYILKGDSLNKYKNLISEEERKSYIKKYWSQYDPYPLDSTNELLDEYNFRVQESNSLYSTSRRPGWKTDQGRVLILYGQPEEVVRLPFSESFFQGGNSLKYIDLEIWYYNRNGERNDLPEELQSIYGRRMFFLFGNLSNLGYLEQLYSSEYGEINHNELFQKTESEK
jgi:GWxTD domain-containing protein